VKGPRYDPLKRVLDAIVAASALVLLSPIFAVVAVAVAAQLGRPVIFSQMRPGYGGQVFKLRKFRSMRALDVSRGQASDDARLTPFGRALRASSLDELPALWNVLRGDMSIVGPRPLLVQYLDRYTPFQARRHEVRPGITGLAQVSGRNSLSWEARFEIDIQYVEKRSPILDLKILYRTVAVVMSRKGVSADGTSTMKEFNPQHRIERQGD